MRIVTWLAASLWLTGVSLAGPAHSGEAAGMHDWPAQGRLVYDVLRGENGMKLGEAVHVWQQGAGRYRMTLDLKTTGLAGLLYQFEYTQISEGRVAEGSLLPDVFEVNQIRRAPEKSVFNWETAEVAVVRKGKTTLHALERGDQDVLSVWHLFSLTPAERLPQKLVLVSNRRASPASISELGEQALRLPAGRFDTHHYRLRADTGKLTIDLWVAEVLHSLPVRLLLTDDKGQELDLKLSRHELPPS